MQTPHSLTRRARSFPHRRDRDASSWPTNHDAAFLRDVIPGEVVVRNEAWTWTIRTTCSVNFARYYLLLLLEDANTHRMCAICGSISSIRSIIQRFLFSMQQTLRHKTNLNETIVLAPLWLLQKTARHTRLKLSLKQWNNWECRHTNVTKISPIDKRRACTCESFLWFAVRDPTLHHLVIYGSLLFRWLNMIFSIIVSIKKHFRTFSRYRNALAI